MADRDGETVGELTENQRRQVEEYLEEEEGGFNQNKGWLAIFLTAVAVQSLRGSTAPGTA